MGKLTPLEHWKQDYAETVRRMATVSPPPKWVPLKPKPLPHGVAERMAEYRKLRSPYSEPK